MHSASSFLLLYILFFQRWYNVSKILAEEAAWKFVKENSIELVVLNPAFVIGPLLQPSLNETSAMILKLIKGNFFVLICFTLQKSYNMTCLHGLFDVFNSSYFSWNSLMKRTFMSKCWSRLMCYVHLKNVFIWLHNKRFHFTTTTTTKPLFQLSAVSYIDHTTPFFLSIVMFVDISLIKRSL